MFWIDTFTSPSTFRCYNFSFGSIPSPHQVHSIAFLQQHLVGEVKVLIQNFLFHRVLHVREVKIYASVSLRTGGRSMFYKHLLFTTWNTQCGLTHLFTNNLMFVGCIVWMDWWSFSVCNLTMEMLKKITGKTFWREQNRSKLGLTVL